MDAATPRTMWTALEPIHAFIYFVPEAPARYEALGLERIAYYFASRSAPMGAVSHGVVTATFYNFSPGLVQRAMRDAWTATSPEDVLAARLAAADEVLTREWRDIDGDTILEASILALDAALACDPGGRPMFAGLAGLAVPEQPHLQLWHALSMLREHRGDGHVAALHASGFGPLDALLTSADYSALAIPQLKKLRGWRDEDWAQAEADLMGRDWLDEDGNRTASGARVRAEMEELTDRLATPPWEHLGEQRTDRLLQLLQPLREAILSTTDLPGSY